MVDKKTEWDKLPVLVEAPDYRKTSGEWVFILSTPKKYEDLAKAFLERIQTTGVVFYKACLPEDLDSVLSSGNGTLPTVSGGHAESASAQIADVETLALRLDMTERNVQLMAKDLPPLLHRPSKNEYDMLESYVLLWRAFKELQSGKNDVYNNERSAAMKLKRQERELDYYERAKKLVSADAVVRAIEKVKAAEKQQILFMPKQLAPRLKDDPAENEAVLEEWAHSFLKGQTEINIADAVEKAPAPDVDKPVEMKKKSKKHSHAKTQRRKESKT